MVDHSNTKLFISWSGPLAKCVAAALHGWLPKLFDNIDLFMSDESIESGQRGMRVIEDWLNGTQFGIVVTTRDNMGASWLNFEAGAISKVVHEDVEQRVAPYLVDFERSAEVVGPLTQFQMKMADKDGTRSLVRAIAGVTGAKVTTVEERFEMFWPELLESIDAAKVDVSTGEAPAKRTPEEIATETLELVRAMRSEGVPLQMPEYRSVIGSTKTLSSPTTRVWKTNSDIANLSWASTMDEPTRLRDVVLSDCRDEGIPEPNMFVSEIGDKWHVSAIVAAGTTPDQLERLRELTRLTFKGRDADIRFGHLEEISEES